MTGSSCLYYRPNDVEVGMNVRKIVLDNYTAKIEIYDKDSHLICILDENSMLVDGIGGVLWDGSIVMLNILDKMDLSDKTVLEFGCGIGICGIFAGLKGGDVTLTDREVDLVTSNVESLNFPKTASVVCKSFIWGEAISLPRQQYDIILVCECACLVNQQEALIQSISALAHQNSIVLVTFDGKPPPNEVQYEAKFDSLMKSRGFRTQCIDYSRVEWYDDVRTDNKCLFSRVYSQEDRDICPQGNNLGTPKDSSEHHIIAYFRPNATNTCSRCHCQYLSLFNTRSCRYHRGYYVCRKHPGETRLSINGLGDSLGYYGNGEEGCTAFFVILFIFFQVGLQSFGIAVGQKIRIVLGVL